MRTTRTTGLIISSAEGLAAPSSASGYRGHPYADGPSRRCHPKSLRMANTLRPCRSRAASGLLGYPRLGDASHSYRWDVTQWRGERHGDWSGARLHSYDVADNRAAAYQNPESRDRYQYHRQAELIVAALVKLQRCDECKQANREHNRLNKNLQPTHPGISGTLQASIRSPLERRSEPRK